MRVHRHCGSAEFSGPVRQGSFRREARLAWAPPGSISGSFDTESAPSFLVPGFGPEADRRETLRCVEVLDRAAGAGTGSRNRLTPTSFY